MRYEMILIYSFNFRSSVAILVRQFQNLDFDCAVCEVHYVPY